MQGVFLKFFNLWLYFHISIHILVNGVRHMVKEFFFLAAAGVLNHFLYEWTGSAVTALFCPVNESTWEHLKLLFFPFLFQMIWNYIRKKPKPAAYFYYSGISVLCGMVSIIALFYTYTGCIGKNFLIMDILIFFAGVWVSLKSMHKTAEHLHIVPSITVTYAGWLILVLCFFVFTCYPPDIPLFFPYE